METTMTRELAFRANDGVEVSLLWHKPTNDLTVSVHDTRSGEQFELEVASDYALDAFHHPYAYAAHHGIEYASRKRTGEAVYA